MKNRSRYEINFLVVLSALAFFLMSLNLYLNWKNKTRLQVVSSPRHANP